MGNLSAYIYTFSIFFAKIFFSYDDNLLNSKMATKKSTSWEAATDPSLKEKMILYYHNIIIILNLPMKGIFGNQHKCGKQINKYVW